MTPIYLSKVTISSLYACTQDTVTRDLYSVEYFAATADISLAWYQTRSDSNLLDWWKFHAKLYLTLAQLAKKYLCIPAASSATEQVFSSSGLIKKCCSLKPDKVNCCSGQNLMNYHLHFVKLLLTRREGIGSTVLCYLLLKSLENTTHLNYANIAKEPKRRHLQCSNIRYSLTTSKY